MERRDRVALIRQPSHVPDARRDPPRTVPAGTCDAAVMSVTMSGARPTSRRRGRRRLLFSVLVGVVVAVTGCQSSEGSSAQPSARELGSDESLIIRTDFRDDALWGRVLAEAMRPIVASTEGDEYVAVPTTAPEDSSSE
ncbi:hypothetical protein [Williamsia soli]|uniref:hypothetical protein n=1 Tax=Williamsia soli TaxID=364929 RepID=UPI001A9D29DD|nr:hypothetical protein [Williamsia soli]